VALCSGLRRGELEALKVGDLDTERGGLVLHAAWTKARKGGFQPLPASVLGELAADAEGKAPDAPLLRVTANQWRLFAGDMKRAGIPRQAFGGKVDFHALRVTYISAVLATGADVKTAQHMARHTTAGLTLNTYGRARSERLTGVAEAVGAELLPSADLAHSLPLMAAGAEGLDVSPISSKGLCQSGVKMCGGSNPPLGTT